MQTMENLIQQFSTIDGVIAAADASALGAIEALNAAGRKNVAVVSINGVPEAVEAVKAGSLLAIAEFDGFKIGCVATAVGLNAIRGQSAPKQITIPECDHHQGQLCALAHPLQGPDLPDAGRVYREEVAPTGLQTRRVLQACLLT